MALTIEPYQPLPIPRTTNSQATKAYRAIAKPYDAFADIFKSGDGPRLRAEFEFGRQIWRDVCIQGTDLHSRRAWWQYVLTFLGLQHWPSPPSSGCISPLFNPKARKYIPRSVHP